MKIFPVIVFSILSVAIPSAKAQLKNLGTSYYTVNGTTLSQAYNDLGSPEAGSMHYDIGPNPYGTVTKACTCSKNADGTFTYSTTTSIDPNQQYSFTGDYYVFLPQWDSKQESRLCAARQNAWNALMSALASHEQQHVDKFVQWFNGAASGYAAQINAVVGNGSGTSCADAQSAAKADFANQVTTIYQKAVAEIAKIEQDFDDSTQHGQTGTPPVVINLNTPCQ